jgi:hypothetical protein
MGCDFIQQLAKHQLHWKPPASALSIPGMNALSLPISDEREKQQLVQME